MNIINNKGNGRKIATIGKHRQRPSVLAASAASAASSAGIPIVTEPTAVGDAIVNTGNARTLTASYLKSLKMPVGGIVRPLERDIKRLIDIRDFRRIVAHSGRVQFGVFECWRVCTKGG